MVMKDVKKLLNNKLVFYAVAALAVVNVAGYATTRSYPCLGAFAVSALVVNHFLKNKVLALLGGLFVANFFYGCGRVHESFKTGENADVSAIMKAAAAKAGEKAQEAMDEADDKEQKCKEGEEWDPELNACKAKAAKKAEIANMVGEIADEVENMENEEDVEGMDHLEEEE
ncbi:MAG: hypothetical protein CML42_09500 [Rhodobacteraceae bacterium]|nr:hypothetical protein [Paracoccaceae bacterium]|tara:strand:- start:3221 stop:3733 length:513 start_codon:yes stop_codon:yes gene_type:complete